jgi:fatty acid desaturase
MPIVVASRDLKEAARDRASAAYVSLPRIALDLALWAVVAAVATALDHPAADALAVTVIGSLLMHDLLVHGHEGAHGLIARRRPVNEVFTWLTHAVVGLSGTAYRAFHLEHHRTVQTEDDPEYRLLQRVARGAPGWSYLAIPLLAHVYVNAYPFTSAGSTRARRRTALDLAAALALHVGLRAAVGTRAYVLFVIAPIFTSLAFVVALRSLAEHHSTDPSDPWTRTRTSLLPRWLALAWSNANYHLEHHLFPTVPWQELPALHRLLASEEERRGSPIGRGFLAESVRLLRTKEHFAGRPGLAPRPGPFVRPGTIAFRMKSAWFRDLLAHAPARRHLWSLYYTGEAYEELHPDAVFVAKLDERLGRLLTRHLHDETRHAAVFRALAAADGAVPAAVAGAEDVGWHLLTHVVPDVVAAAREPRSFTAEEAARYMAFLHVLELRSLSDLCALRLAASGLGRTDLAEAITRILRDEVFHASYTHRAVYRLLPADAARRTLDEVRRAERRHYTESLERILERFGELGARPRSLAGRARWWLLRRAARLGLASPLLPLYERLPRHLTPDAEEK